MSEEIDQILIEQWDAAHRRRKIYERYRKLAPHEHVLLDAAEHALNLYMDYLVSMMINKELTKQKRKRKKLEAVDVLQINPVYEWWRNALFIGIFGSRIFYRSMLQYMAAYSFRKSDNG